MTVEDIFARTRTLQALEQRDAEAAAAGAENLRTEVLAAIADGAVDGRALAAAALEMVSQDVGGT